MEKKNKSIRNSKNKNKSEILYDNKWGRKRKEAQYKETLRKLEKTEKDIIFKKQKKIIKGKNREDFHSTFFWRITNPSIIGVKET